MVFGAGVLGTAAAAIGAHRYLMGKNELNETIRLGARYVAIDLTSWILTVAITYEFAKKDSAGQSEVNGFLFLASKAGLIFTNIFFNWATQPLQSTSPGNDPYSIKNKWAIGSAAFLGGSVVWIAALYFMREKA